MINILREMKSAKSKVNSGKRIQNTKVVNIDTSEEVEIIFVISLTISTV